MAAAHAPVPIDQFDKLIQRPSGATPARMWYPADQADFLTATKFMRRADQDGHSDHRASAPFSVGGKQYPAGSFVVKTAQPFHPHILDMFEPQDHRTISSIRADRRFLRTTALVGRSRFKWACGSIACSRTSRHRW